MSESKEEPKYKFSTDFAEAVVFFFICMWLAGSCQGIHKFIDKVKEPTKCAEAK